MKLPDLNIRNRAVAILSYLGDAAHRRFVAVMVAYGVTHFVGKEIASDDIVVGLELLVAGLGGMWSSRTPQLDDVA
jgi:hypothetical protein